MSTVVSPVSDAAYVVLSRAKGRCAICAKKGADTVTPIVPVSYGGLENEQSNLQAAHARCAELRHQIEGSSPEPPDPDGLRRLLSIGYIRGMVLDVLYRAAIAHRVRVYNSVDQITLLDRRIEANIGFALRGRPCPEGVSASDWAWLQSSEAFSALHDAAWAMLASEG